MSAKLALNWMTGKRMTWGWGGFYFDRMNRNYR